MATAVAPHSIGVKLASDLPGRRFDHVFFSAMALLMLATVFVGFAPTYYLAGMFRAPLPSLIIHLHGAAFSAWIVLLVTQTSLVSATVWISIVVLALQASSSHFSWSYWAFWQPPTTW